jgi:hypothetical protein
MSPGTGRCAEQKRVDAHFEGTLAPSDEHAMREHLPECAVCNKRYERFLLLEQIDPSAALGAEERIGRGLGLGQRAPTWARWAAPVAALSMAAAVLLFLGLRGTTPSDAGFTARGGGDPLGSSVVVYRATHGAKPSPAGDSVGARDELAFAYDNVSAKRYLVIFGIDEHRHVFWYHPGWSNPSDDPTSIAIEMTPGVHHLHEAIAHDLDGRELEIHALFTDAPLSVKTIERLVATETPRLASAYAPGARESVLRLRVER